MSPVTKTEAMPAVSLTLVKPASPTHSSVNVSNGLDDTSRAQLMLLIYNLMIVVGENMSSIQNSYAQNQLDQAKIAQNQADGTEKETQQYLSKLSNLEEKRAEAKKWGVFGTIMKWIGVAIGLLVGALLCETPLGFIVLAAVIGFTASPLFDTAVSALGNAIGKAIGNTTWGSILAQAIILVVITVATCGAEGLSTGLTKLMTTAGEDAAEVGTQTTVQVAKQIAEEVEEEVTEEASSQLSQTSEQASEQTASKVSAKDFKPRWSYASAGVFTQTLLSTNLISNLALAIVDSVPGAKKNELVQIITQILALILELAVAFASFKGVSGEGVNLMQKLAQVTDSPILTRVAAGSIVGTTQVVNGIAVGGQSWYTYEQGQIQGELAPIQGSLMFGESFFQILTQLASAAQQAYKSLMHSNTILFNTNFSSDWQACVRAQQYQG